MNEVSRKEFQLLTEATLGMQYRLDAVRMLLASALGTISAQPELAQDFKQRLHRVWELDSAVIPATPGVRDQDLEGRRQAILKLLPESLVTENLRR